MVHKNKNSGSNLLCVRSSKNKNVIFGSEMSHKCTKFTKILVFIFYFSTQSSTPKTFFYKKHYQYVVEAGVDVWGQWRFPMRSLSFKLAKLSNILHPKSGQNDTSKLEIPKTVDLEKNGFDKTCSYNLPQHFMFWWPRLNLKSEINISKNVEKRYFWRFSTSPHSSENWVHGKLY